MIVLRGQNRVLKDYPVFIKGMQKQKVPVNISILFTGTKFNLYHYLYQRFFPSHVSQLDLNQLYPLLSHFVRRVLICCCIVLLRESL